MPTHHRRGVLAGLVAAALLVAACGSDDDAGPEGLRDIREPRPADDGGEPDDADSEVDDENAAEGDPDEAAIGVDGPDDDPSDGESVTFDGVTVPDDALQINDDLDMPPDLQLEILMLVRAAYEYTVRALDTGEYEIAALESFYSGGELDGLLASLARFENEGLRQISDGTVTHYIRVTHYSEGTAIVDHCTMAGPDDGIIDRESGEFTFQQDVPERVLGFELGFVETDAGDSGWRIIDGAELHDVDCP